MHSKFSINRTLALPIPRIQTVQDLSAVTRPKSHNQNLTSHTQVLSDIKILYLKLSVQKEILIPCSEKRGDQRRLDLPGPLAN